MILLICLVLAVLASPFKSKSRLEAENAVLRHQLIVLRRKVRGRAQLSNNDRWFFVQLYRWFLYSFEITEVGFDQFDPQRAAKLWSFETQSAKNGLTHCTNFAMKEQYYQHPHPWHGRELQHPLARIVTRRVLTRPIGGARAAVATSAINLGGQRMIDTLPCGCAPGRFRELGDVGRNAAAPRRYFSGEYRRSTAVARIRLGVRSWIDHVS
jgi:hypothetical protein